MQVRRTGGPAGYPRSGWWRTVVTLSKRNAATGREPIVLAKLFDAIRRIAGMPDYEAYLAHVRRCHPEAQPMTERQFYQEFVRARYGDGPTRCC
jgi:uncharacterized short protein YbdD (DUF466 family)